MQQRLRPPQTSAPTECTAAAASNSLDSYIGIIGIGQNTQSSNNCSDECAVPNLDVADTLEGDPGLVDSILATNVVSESEEDIFEFRGLGFDDTA
jgi:hypothetical protein